MAEGDFNFDEFDDDLADEDEKKVVEKKKVKKEEKVKKEKKVEATDGEDIEIDDDDEDDGEVPDIDDILEPTEFEETPRVSEFLEQYDTKKLKCVCLAAKIVSGSSEYADSAFIKVTVDFKKDKDGLWIRTSSAIFKEQVDELIAKKAFPVAIRLAGIKSKGKGKEYYVING